MNFALDGKTAQGRYVRDFYPHNIRIPSIVVECESPSQEEYANIIEFIHESQRKSVGGGQKMQLYIKQGGPKLLAEVKSAEQPSNFTSPKEKIARTKGFHKEILAEGFVETVQRSHKRWEYKKDFFFEFIIATMNSSAAYSDTSPAYPQQKTYAEILAEMTVTGLGKEKTIAQAAEGEEEVAKTIGNIKKIVEFF